jgi:hypothetical protein
MPIRSSNRGAKIAHAQCRRRHKARFEELLVNEIWFLRRVADPGRKGAFVALGASQPGRIVRATSAASEPAASATMKPAGSSVPRANVRKPSWSSTIKIAADGCTRPVWHRAQPLALGQTLITFPGWPAQNSGRGPIW